MFCIQPSNNDILVSNARHTDSQQCFYVIKKKVKEMQSAETIISLTQKGRPPPSSDSLGHAPCFLGAQCTSAASPVLGVSDVPVAAAGQLAPSVTHLELLPSPSPYRYGGWHPTSQLKKPSVTCKCGGLNSPRGKL